MVRNPAGRKVAAMLAPNSAARPPGPTLRTCSAPAAIRTTLAAAATPQGWSATAARRCPLTVSQPTRRRHRLETALPPVHDGVGRTQAPARGQAPHRFRRVAHSAVSMWPTARLLGRLSGSDLEPVKLGPPQLPLETTSAIPTRSHRLATPLREPYAAIGVGPPKIGIRLSPYTREAMLTEPLLSGDTSPGNATH
jgi:hypothetical protein